MVYVSETLALEKRVSEELRKAILLSLAYQNENYVKKAFDYAEVTTYSEVDGRLVPVKKAKISKRNIKVDVSPKNLNIRVLVPRKLLRKIGKATYEAVMPVGAILYREGKEVLSISVPKPNIIVTKRAKFYIVFTVTVGF